MGRAQKKDMYAEIYSQSVSDALRLLDSEQLTQAERTKRRNAILFSAREEKRKRRSLRDSFGLGYIEPRDFKRVMRILREVSSGRPINDKDLKWLGSNGIAYWSEKLCKTHHGLMAKSFSNEWEKTHNGWSAVNASSHWRKADEPLKALPITEGALRQSNSKKLRSALLTTRGGAFRDLCEHNQALRTAEEAHELAPGDFRPCTLLGALYVEVYDFAEGLRWYEKAEALGANRLEINKEIRSIVDAFPPEKHAEIVAFLKNRGADRLD